MTSDFLVGGTLAGGAGRTRRRTVERGGLSASHFSRARWVCRWSELSSVCSAGPWENTAGDGLFQCLQRYSVRRTASIGAAGGGGLGGWRRCGPCCDCVYEKRAPYAGKLAYVCYSSCWGGGSPWREEVRTCTLISRGLYTLYSCLNIRWWYRHSFGRSSGRWHGDDHAVRDRAA